MLFGTRSSIIPCAVFVLSTAAVHAQSFSPPKVGDFHTDKKEFGFRVKVPNGWELIPPQPSEEDSIIAKYVPPQNKYMLLGPPDKPVRVDTYCWLVKFDRRKKPEAADAKKEGVHRFAPSAPKDIQAWLKMNAPGGEKLKLNSQKDFTVQKIEATEYLFETPDDDPKMRLGYYAAVYKLSPDYDIGIVFDGPADPKKMPKWEQPCSQMGRSFSPVEMKEVAAGPEATYATLRDKVRAEQQAKIDKLGAGWKLYETPHYFILTPEDDKAFVEELKQRLERIHEIYEQDYPAAKAEEYRKIGETVKTGDQKSPEEKAQEEVDKEFKKAMMGGATPQELASCSRVRVFTDHDAYIAYGAPGQSAGYWSPSDQELVLYDDKANGGRRDTWAVLNHEGFHQYIFYFFGALSPHSWYNEGSGDFYSGYTWKINRFVLKAFDWRVGEIKEAIQKNKFVPLETFVRYTQAEYYGNNKEGVTGGQNYAQGWSLIYFLRTGKKANAKGWDPAWDNILENYLRVLATTNNLKQAVDEAFKGVDMNALQQAWIDYTK